MVEKIYNQMLCEQIWRKMILTIKIGSKFGLNVMPKYVEKRLNAMQLSYPGKSFAVKNVQPLSILWENINNKGKVHLCCNNMHNQQAQKPPTHLPY